MPSFQVGAIQVQVIQDGAIRTEPARLLGGRPEEEWRSFATPEADGKIVISVQCLLVRVGERLALLDTGLGLAAHSPETDGVDHGRRGRLMPELARLGVAPEQVDVVVLSHGHGDHLGGNVVAGRPVFPRARYLLDAADFRHFTAAEMLAEWPFFGEQLLPLREQDRLDMTEGEEREILPGVRLLPTPGHTPGHVCVGFTSGGEHGLYVGDLVHHPAQVSHPEWSPTFDWMPTLSAEMRQRVLDRARVEGSLVLTAHFPFPGVGRLAEGWRPST
jgi:glyoxylase-like metal-dependent hydrolase (beta-lactamase superfamily II)